MLGLNQVTKGRAAMFDTATASLLSRAIADRTAFTLERGRCGASPHPAQRAVHQTNVRVAVF
jgi:Zn-dependent M32 family carboxypeptidase